MTAGPRRVWPGMIERGVKPDFIASKPVDIHGAFGLKARDEWAIAKHIGIDWNVSQLSFPGLDSRAPFGGANDRASTLLIHRNFDCFLTA